MAYKHELEFYDLKSAAELALADFRKNCEKTGRNWKEELENVICDAEKD